MSWDCTVPTGHGASRRTRHGLEHIVPPAPTSYITTARAGAHRASHITNIHTDTYVSGTRTPRRTTPRAHQGVARTARIMSRIRRVFGTLSGYLSSLPTPHATKIGILKALQQHHHRPQVAQRGSRDARSAPWRAAVLRLGHRPMAAMAATFCIYMMTMAMPAYAAVGAALPVAKAIVDHIPTGFFAQKGTSADLVTSCKQVVKIRSQVVNKLKSI